MVRKKGLKTARKKDAITESQIKQLAKKLEKYQTNKPKTPKKEKKQSYTVTQASEKLEIPRSKILRLIKSGKIQASKDKAPTTPYMIPETEMQKLLDIAMGKAAEEKEVVVLKKIQEGSKTDQSQDQYYDDYIEIRKNFIATMRHLAAAQEHIASTISKLADKI